MLHYPWFFIYSYILLSETSPIVAQKYPLFFIPKNMIDKKLDKISKIKETLKLTRDKRKSQVCRVFKVKIQSSKLSEAQRASLKMMFVDGKRLFNSILNFSQQGNNIDDYDLKRKDVDVFVQGNFEQKPLTHISSQMKQSVVKQLISNIKSLSSLKKKGKKVGKINFKSSCEQLDLKQYGVTYNFKGKNKMKIQGVPGAIRINGAHQFLDKGFDFANAKLLNTPKGYYVSITTYSEKQDLNPNLEEIGIDMGCSTSITISNGEKINVKIEEPERLKQLQQKLRRKVKNSNNYNKNKKKIKVEYAKITNRKNDAANKVVNKLLQHEVIYFQDENLKGWHKGGHGKAVQHSILGRVKAKLLKSTNAIMIDRFLPTTKGCYYGHNSIIKLWDRTFTCEACGLSEDRDVHAAKMVKSFGEQMKDKIRQGLAEYKLEDLRISGLTSKDVKLNS